MVTGAMDDSELARRSAASFGEMLAAVGLWGVGPASVVRRPDAVGAHACPAEPNPWFDAIVVPYGAVPPIEDPSLPYCVWTFSHQVHGRVEDPSIATPCMGFPLDDPLPLDVDPVEIGTPSLAVVGAVNDRAYGTDSVFGPLAARLRDDRIATCGIRVDGRFVCVAMTLALGDDLGIHYVATEEGHRRHGLATGLLATVIHRARAEGMATTTLQASPDGLHVYRRMGFREVGLLHGFVRSGVRPAG
jgi:GNAT superfamily N-acetyltransferase